jgi:ribosomal-protein-alanine N-acetyltransferase
MELHPLDKNHFEALFNFELRNRGESFVPPRPESYKLFSGFTKASTYLIQELSNGESYFFVGLQGKEVVARANLVDIENGNAEVGRRVCGQSIGKGYATAALGLLIEFAQSKLCLSQLTEKSHLIIRTR